jgi:hypothetical protein
MLIATGLFAAAELAAAAGVVVKIFAGIAIDRLAGLLGLVMVMVAGLAAAVVVVVVVAAAAVVAGLPGCSRCVMPWTMACRGSSAGSSRW